MQSELGGGCDGGGKGALVQKEVSGTLGCNNDQTIFCLQGNGIDRADTAGCNGKGWTEDVSYTLNTIDRHAICASFKGGQGAKAGGIGYAVEQAPCLNAEGATPHIVILNDQGGNIMSVSDDVSATLRAQGHGHQPCVLDMTHANDVTNTLRSIKSDPDHIPCAYYRKRVRRLTPLECERLQGFPDHWTDIGAWVDSKGKKHKRSDAARYKALGNSIALPPWKWVLKRLCAQYERDATMASLFDGIGGFPLLWEQLNGEGSCVWASEIEEFPMAVTKLRFSPTGQKG